MKWEEATEKKMFSFWLFYIVCRYLYKYDSGLLPRCVCVCLLYGRTCRRFAQQTALVKTSATRWSRRRRRRPISICLAYLYFIFSYSKTNQPDIICLRLCQLRPPPPLPYHHMSAYRSINSALLFFFFFFFLGFNFVFSLNRLDRWCTQRTKKIIFFFLLIIDFLLHPSSPPPPLFFIYIFF